MYLRHLVTSTDVSVVACADLDPARAAARAAEFSIPRACTPEDVLADRTIELVVNLTRPATHAGVTRAALEAGKHVYSEKPLALSAAEGAELLALARRSGLLLGAAPDTFLGPSIQAVRALVDDGAIGKVVGASISFITPGSELWHPDPEFLFAPGGGPVFDEGPYFLTALVTVLGPIASVTGQSTTIRAERVIGKGPRAGTRFTATTDTHVVATLGFASGALATALLSFEILASTLPPIELYGTTGSLRMAFPGYYDGAFLIGRRHDDPWETHRPSGPPIGNARGIGVEELARAIGGAIPPRIEAGLALHVLEAMEAIHRSAADGRRVTLTTVVERPAPYVPNPGGAPRATLSSA
jgi:predicted dehydrogenase